MSNLIRLTESRFAPAIIFGLWVLFFALIAMSLGLENSYDLKNYHWYEPFMILHGRIDFDLVPAQRQTFHAPLQDLLFYGIKHGLQDHPLLLKATLSLPAAITAFWRPALHGRSSLPTFRGGASLAVSPPDSGPLALPVYPQSQRQ